MKCGTETYTTEFFLLTSYSETCLYDTEFEFVVPDTSSLRKTPPIVSLTTRGNTCTL